MRIAILSKDAPPVPSGIGDHSIHLAEAWRERGMAVTVICNDAASRNVLCHPVMPWAGPQIIQAIQRTAPELIFWQYNPFQFGRKGVPFGAARLAREIARRAPLVIIAHELWYPWWRNGVRGLVWAVSQRLEFSRLMRHASKVVVTTPARRRALADRRPSRAGDIAVVPIGPNILPADFSPDVDVRKLYDVPPCATLIGHFGSLGDGRDVAPLLSAIGDLRAKGLDARLMLIGRTGAELASPWILQSGVLDSADVSAHLAACDMYVFIEPDGPTIRKGSLLAALAHGLPTIAFDGRGTDPDFVMRGAVLPVKPEAGQIASAVERLLADDDLARSLSRAARQLVADRFSWETIAEKLLSVAMDSNQHASRHRRFRPHA